MKLDFVDFFCRETYFDIFYIRMDNDRIGDIFCRSTARTFNYLIRISLDSFFSEEYLPLENCHLQLDNRNEKPDANSFLENYLNTELTLGRDLPVGFTTEYFDSANNSIIQIADVFSNLYYSQLLTNAYTEAFELMKNRGILKDIYEFP